MPDLTYPARRIYPPCLFVLLPIDEDEPFYTLHFAWCPENAIKNRSKADRVPYDLWNKQGHIEATPGSVVDYAYILKRIEAIGKQYNLKAILFDRWGSTKIVKDLEDMGLTVLEFGQGFASMSPPSKEMEKLVLARKIVFPDNPALEVVFLKCDCRNGCSREHETEQERNPKKKLTWLFRQSWRLTARYEIQKRR